MNNRRKLIAGNWKMNLTAPEGVGLARSVAETAARRPDVDVVLCPSFTLLHSLKGIGGIGLGGQDVFWLDSGAYTGEVSAAMLADAGCHYCIVGHSERRGRFGKSGIEDHLLPYFSDTDEVVALKLRSLLYAGIRPILCVGETSEERNAGHTESVIGGQLQKALSGVTAEECHEMAVAYEPVWAIGTGNVCDVQEANRVCRFIRSRIGGIASRACSDAVRVLYGGSVNAANSPDLFAQPEIDGVLVGGASLKADEFARIILAPSVETV